ncbi:hypothetical protein NXW13_00705 [Bacteroides thetaiotaomicron]|nr:hypothetical protein [Bacteroides thetaiotaomicron]
MTEGIVFVKNIYHTTLEEAKNNKNPDRSPWWMSDYEAGSFSRFASTLYGAVFVDAGKLLFGSAFQMRTAFINGISCLKPFL